MTSFGQSGFNASGVVPAADIALEDINSHPDVLSGYQLVYDTVRDSQVSNIKNAALSTLTCELNDNTCSPSACCDTVQYN